MKNNNYKNRCGRTLSIEIIEIGSRFNNSKINKCLTDSVTTNMNDDL